MTTDTSAELASRADFDLSMELRDAYGEWENTESPEEARAMSRERLLMAYLYALSMAGQTFGDPAGVWQTLLEKHALENGLDEAGA